jgi:hypothetical protein
MGPSWSYDMGCEFYELVRLTWFFFILLLIDFFFSISSFNIRLVGNWTLKFYPNIKQYFGKLWVNFQYDPTSQIENYDCCRNTRQ